MGSCAEAIDVPPLPPLKIVPVASAVLIDRDGRVLLARRPPGKLLGGLWEFPGGKLEDGEAPEQALTRELKEELAIETGPSCLAPVTFVSHRYEEYGFHLLMLVYACRVWRGMVEPQEGQEIAWVYPRDFRNYAMPPADLPLVPVLQDMI